MSGGRPESPSLRRTGQGKNVTFFRLALRCLSTGSRGLVALGLVLGCNSRPGSLGDLGTGGGSASTGGANATDTGAGPETTGATISTGGGSTGSSGGSDSDGPTTRFDVDGGPPGDDGLCYVNDDELTGEAPIECTDKAPPDSFEPRIEWTWNPSVGQNYSIVTPLVANLTDDLPPEGIDLCDIPDIVVVVRKVASNSAGMIYVLDGATGEEHFRMDEDVSYIDTPALGDIDDDGMVEIVTRTPLEDDRVIAFEHDGTLKWISDTPAEGNWGSALALADMDNDGDVEIIVANRVYDHNGVHLFTTPQPPGEWGATCVADLDGDADLELVLGHAAYHHNNNEYYVNNGVQPGFPQVANLDDDPEPEVLLTNREGITLLEHNGDIKYQNVRPTGAAPGPWLRPATVHDFDGDGTSEYALSSAAWYTAYEPDASIIWSTEVQDRSGYAAGTAFDFLGDGTAEAMYADEDMLFVFDNNGESLLEIPRTSSTWTEYPVVADVDNDGSAEIVVVTNNQSQGNQLPTVQVIGDIDDRWIQARRIWNQHTYHVTNVYEDGRIPQFEPPSWKYFNTFRTNIQIESGQICDPPG